MAADPTPKPPPTDGLVRQIYKLLVGLLPKPLRDIFEQGLLTALIVVVMALVVVPTLVPLVAAFWMRLLGGMQNSAAKGLRDAYLEVLYEGFAIEEVAARSNARLDYLQVFDADLKPKTAPSREFQVNIVPRQKAIIDVRVVAFSSETPGCSVPEDDMELVAVSLGGQLIRTLKREPKTIKLSQKWWETNAEALESEDHTSRLTFRLADPVRALTCGQVHIEGSLLVFKDLFPESDGKHAE